MSNLTYAAGLYLKRRDGVPTFTDDQMYDECFWTRWSGRCAICGRTLLPSQRSFSKVVRHCATAAHVAHKFFLLPRDVKRRARELQSEQKKGA